MEMLITHATLIIQRLDKYISDANVKGNFILVINTFIGASILANYNNLKCLASTPSIKVLYNIDQALIFILTLTIMVIILKAVFPFLHSGHSKDGLYRSKIFFNSITDYKSKEEYKLIFEKQGEKDILEDLTKQIYQISLGLRTKYRLLQYAIMLIYFELGTIFFLIYILWR
jgi:hypothetical protein